MNILARVALRTALLAACSAGALGAELPILWGGRPGRPVQVVGVEKGQVLGSESGLPTPLGPEAVWLLRGSIADGIAFAEWSPPYSLRRTASAGAGVVGVSTVSVGRDGAGAGFLSEAWPKALETPSLLVVAWVVEGEASQVKVQVLDVPEKARAQGVDANFKFELEEREMGGHPCVLLWSKGGFVAPEPRFKEPLSEGTLRACLLGQPDILEAAVKAGVDLARTDRHGMTVLALVAEAGRTQCIPLLLKEGKGIALLADKGGFTPAHHAARNGREHALLLLAQADAANVRTLSGANPGPARLPVEFAAVRGHTGCLRALAQTSTLPDSGLRVGLAVEAIGRGDYPVAAALLEAGDDAVKRAPALGALLREASAQNKASLVSLLLRAGVPAAAPGPDGLSPLEIAVGARNAGIARELLAAGAKPGPGLLHQAVRVGSSELAGVLVRAGAPLEAVDVEGRTPLVLALELGGKGAATTLLNAGAKVPATGEAVPRLVEALFRMDLAAGVRSLVKQGWDVNTRLAGGWSVLAVADLMKATRCAALLREAEADEAKGQPCEVVRAEELDTKLKPSTPIRVRDPRAEDEVYPKQNVSVDVVVDMTGEPRFIRVRNCPDPRVERAVGEAVAKARYESPLRAGKPVAASITLSLAIPSSRDRLVPVK